MYESSDLSDTRHSSASRGNTPLRPDEIPGAVRVLPGPCPKKGFHHSIARSASTESANRSFAWPRHASPFSTGPRRKLSLGTPPPPTFAYHQSRIRANSSSFAVTYNELKSNANNTVTTALDGSFSTTSTRNSLWNRTRGHVATEGAKAHPKDQPVSHMSVFQPVATNENEASGSLTLIPQAPSRPTTNVTSATTSNSSTMERSSMTAFSNRSRSFIATDVSIPSLESAATSATSTLEKARTLPSMRHELKTPVNEAVMFTDSECEEMTTLSHRASKKHHHRVTSKSADVNTVQPTPAGYEADTDDTLRRKRKSVREMARSFQEAEDACPSPWPLRPSRSFVCNSESEYESDVERFWTTIRSNGRGSSRTTPEPGFFLHSRAYLPPKWAPPPRPPPTEAKESTKSFRVQEDTEHGQRMMTMQSQTKVIRFNRQVIPEFHQDQQARPDQPSIFNLSQEANGEPENGDFASIHSQVQREDFLEKMQSVLDGEGDGSSRKKKSIPVFRPTKFVPGPIQSDEEHWQSRKSEAGKKNQKIRAKWAPSDSETDEPSYRKIKPHLPAKRSRVQSEFGQMSDRFKSKVQEFTDNINSKDKANGPGGVDSVPFAYHDSKQTCEKGSQQIDPDTGLIYFKYDFGYEFGVVVPGMTDDGDDGAGKEEEHDAHRGDAESLFHSMTGDLKPTVGSKVRVPELPKRVLEIKIVSPSFILIR